MTTPTQRTFLTLGPAGMGLEVLPGQPGTARFTYALDEGPSRDAVAIPGERYDLGDGITLTFGAGTYVEGDTCSFLAGDPRAPRRGKKRPGQWTDRARAKRARRLEKARARANHEWTRRAWGRQQVVIGGRRGKRAFAEWVGRR